MALVALCIGRGVARSFPMKITTFNCNSIRQRLGVVLEWLEANEPDMLALQETKVVDELFPASAFEDVGWHVTFRGQKGYNGVAVVTRSEPERVSFGLGDDDGESEPRLIDATVDGVRLLNTYIPQGYKLDSDKFQFKLRWLERLERYLRERVDLTSDFVWVGDLNIAPTEIDVYDHKKIWPHVAHCQEMTDWYDRFIGLGLVDVFRKHLPEPGNYTFWDYRYRRSVEANRGWRIDHILASPPMAERSRAVEVDVEPRRRPKPSDHTFVTAIFD